MSGYTKLFHSIIHSTIWREAPATKILWVTMLAMADQNGEVQASLPGLADAAKIGFEDCEVALAVLMSPDRHSRTKDHEGRRIAEIDGGWIVVNHGKFRRIQSAEERKQKATERKAKWRAYQKKQACP